MLLLPSCSNGITTKPKLSNLHFLLAKDDGGLTDTCTDRFGDVVRMDDLAVVDALCRLVWTGDVELASAQFVSKLKQERNYIDNQLSGQSLK